MTLERFLGGSPLAVILKLATASIIIGVVLSFFEIDPGKLYDLAVQFGNWLSDLGFGAVRHVFRWFILGAIIVVPLWLISRAFSLFGSRGK